MTTAAPSKKPAALFAHRAIVGQEYISIKDGHIVKIKEQKGEKGTVLQVKIPGYGFGKHPVTVDARYLLRPIPAQPEAKKATPKPSPAKPAPKGESVEAQEKRNRLPKMTDKTGTPRVEIDGHNHRAHYRAQLSAFKAKECESATKKQCGCRCAGVLHGKSHAGWIKWEQEQFVKFNGPIPADVVAKYIRTLGGVRKHGGKKPEATVKKPEPAKKAPAHAAKAEPAKPVRKIWA